MPFRRMKRRRVVARRRVGRRTRMSKGLFTTQTLVLRCKVSMGGGDDGSGYTAPLVLTSAGTSFPPSSNGLVAGTTELLDNNSAFLFRFDFSRMLDQFRTYLHNFTRFKILGGSMGIRRIDTLAGTKLWVSGAGYNSGNTPTYINFPLAASSRPAVLMVHYLWMPYDSDTYGPWNFLNIKNHPNCRHFNLRSGKRIAWPFRAQRQTVMCDNFTTRQGSESTETGQQYMGLWPGKTKSFGWFSSRLIMPIRQSINTSSSAPWFGATSGEAAGTWGPDMSKVYRILSRTLLLAFELSAVGNNTPTVATYTALSVPSGAAPGTSENYDVPITLVRNPSHVVWCRDQTIRIRCGGGFQEPAETVDALLPIFGYESGPNASWSMYEKTFNRPVLMNPSSFSGTSTNFGAPAIAGGILPVQTEQIAYLATSPEPVP